MIRRLLTVTALALVAAAPSLAQGGDPDKNVKGGALPAGWMGRTDQASKKLEDARFVAMGNGWHVTTGPAAIFWSDKYKVKGPFRASATFAQTKAPTHPEAYGIFFQGNKLSEEGQNYAYFLVRGDGKFLVKHRAGKDVHNIMEWTANPAIKTQDAAGQATNKLTVDATRKDSVRLLVNGVQVHALDGAHMGNTDGYVGLRVNHNLDVHISDFTVDEVRAAAAKPAAKKAVARKKVTAAKKG